MGLRIYYLEFKSNWTISKSLDQACHRARKTLQANTNWSLVPVCLNSLKPVVRCTICLQGLYFDGSLPWNLRSWLTHLLWQWNVPLHFDGCKVRKIVFAFWSKPLPFDDCYVFSGLGLHSCIWVWQKWLLFTGAMGLQTSWEISHKTWKLRYQKSYRYFWLFK